MRNFLGFEPENKTATSINSKIEKVVSLSPSDSHESTFFEKHGDLFVGEIKLVSSQGIFLARSIEKNLSKLTNTITQSIEKQLKSWRSSHQPSDDSGKEPSQDFKKTSGYGKSVLIIDDDHDSVQILELALKRAGCFVHFISDGSQAAAEIAKSNYDLIVLDWFMPTINGGDTLAQAENMIATSNLVRSRGLDTTIPVIIYSAHEIDSFDKFPECEFFTFIDIWKKQFNYNELSTRLAPILNNLN